MPAARSWPEERSGFVALLILEHSVTRRAVTVKLRCNTAILTVPRLAAIGRSGGLAPGTMQNITKASVQDVGTTGFAPVGKLVRMG